MRVGVGYYNLEMMKNYKQKNQTIDKNKKSNKVDKMDSIKIDTNPEKARETAFAKELSKTIVEEIKQGYAKQDIESLRGKIKSGHYEIDVNNIAEKILVG